jgi:hypothetical protein
MSNHQHIYSDNDLPDYCTERETRDLDRRRVDQANLQHQLEQAAFDGTNLLRTMAAFTKLHVGLKEK